MFVIPTHIAIIMDGNGRWAKRKGFPRSYGHHEGVKSVKRVISACSDLGIKYLTLYTLSTENWKRPEKEIKTLMNLLGKHLNTSIIKLPEYKEIRVRVIGRWHELPDDLPHKIQAVIDDTRDHCGLNLTLAVNYGGRREIMDAVERMVKDSKSADKLVEINEELFNRYLYAPEIPDPDLFIRTSGEYRISNFLLWQSAYSEIYVTKTLWPDFGKSDLIKAIKDYQKRGRKFGAV